MSKKQKRGFQVRDFRDKGFFVVDDLYLNGYAKHLGTSASMIYFSLCRHADKEQRCFPSQDLIAEELGLHPRTVLEKIKVLEDWGMIRKDKIRSDKGKWLNNVYYLLDKSEWKTLPGEEKLHMETMCSFSAKPGVEKLHIKDTHKKDTHTTDVENKNVENFLKKCARWAYDRADTSPDCSRESFIRSVRGAIGVAGLTAVHKAFEYQTNAIQFLKEIKTL